MEPLASEQPLVHVSRYDGWKSVWKGVKWGAVSLAAIAVPMLVAWAAAPGNLASVLPPKYVWLEPALIALAIGLNNRAKNKDK